MQRAGEEALYILVDVTKKQVSAQNQDAYAECVVKILEHINQSDNYLFQTMVVPREHAVHGCGFVDDLLKKEMPDYIRPLKLPGG